MGHKRKSTGLDKSYFEQDTFEVATSKDLWDIMANAKDGEYFVVLRDTYARTGDPCIQVQRVRL